MSGTKALIAFLLICSVSIAPMAFGQTSGSPLGANARNETPTGWFVELNTPPTADGGNRASIAAEQANFRANARALGLNYRERYAYQDLFNGFSIRIAASDVSKLQRVPGIKRIYPVMTVNLPDTVSGTPDQQDWLTMTGADVVQNELGFKGDGVRVAVMDTGVDYHHPDLGGCFGPSCHVTMGYDLVGDAFNNTTVPNPTPDPDPMDCNGHGTHVSGIIGANGKGLAGHVTGVAPEVELHMYRVFGCTGSTSDDIMLKAMEMILADGADVLNMSIGSAFDAWSESPTAAGSDRLARKGIVVVASAGNNGPGSGSAPGGPYSTGSPSTGTKVISVASFENLSVKLPAFTISTDDKAIGYFSASGAPPAPTSGSLPIQATVDPIGCTAQAAGSLAGKAALIKRGTCTFYAKAMNALNAGASAVILYNNQPGFVSPTVVPPVTTPPSPPVTIPVVSITQADGTTIVSRLGSGVTLTWTDQLTDTPNPNAGLVSTFSSFGPTAELQFKPDVGAPGGNIYSTFPLALGGYATLSGTSMASPNVAGSVALLLQARPHTPVVLARELLQNTAVPANWNGNPGLGFLDNVHLQGAGLVHIDKAIETQVSVDPSKLALGESQAGPATPTLTFTNTGDNPVTYDLSHVAALTTSPAEFTVGEAIAPATVNFSASTITVPAHGTASVSATITAPGTPALYTYGGYLVATPEGGGQTLRVPYMGLVGNYQSIHVLGSYAGLPFLARSDGTPVTNGMVFTMADADNIPYFFFQLTHAARLMSATIYSATGGGLGKSWQQAFRFDYLPRNSSNTGYFDAGFDGTTANGGGKITTLPNGNYIMVVTVLKPLGDPSNPADVETYTSPMFTIQRQP